MADPHSLINIHDSLAKQVAARAAQGDPATAPLRTETSVTRPEQWPSASDPKGIVKQDLNVLAARAKDYSAGQAAGNVLSQEQATQTNLLADEARAAADKRRADEAALMQMRLEAERLQNEAAAQARAQALAETRARAARGGGGGGGGSDDELEAFKAFGKEQAGIVAFDFMTRSGPNTGGALQDIVLGGLATNPREAKLAFDRLTKQGMYKGANKDTFNKYTEAYYRALSGQTYTLPPKAKPGAPGTAGSKKPAPKKPPSKPNRNRSAG